MLHRDPSSFSMLPGAPGAREAMRWQRCGSVPGMGRSCASVSLQKVLELRQAAVTGLRAQTPAPWPDCAQHTGCHTGGIIPAPWWPTFGPDPVLQPDR